MRALALCIVAFAAGLAPIAPAVVVAHADTGAPASDPTSLSRAPLAVTTAVATPRASAFTLDVQRPSETPRRQPVFRSCRHPAHVVHVELAAALVRPPTTPSPAALVRRTQVRARVGGADADPTDTGSLT